MKKHQGYPTNLLRGFTLIELLVVIALVGILIVAGLASYTLAQRQGRDARRQSDIRTIQTAMEEDYANNGNTYHNLATVFTGGLIPDDPDPDENYDFNNTTSTYCACARLERPVGNADLSSGNCASGITWTQGGDYFCAINQQ